jgi:hypothetical protein
MQDGGEGQVDAFFKDNLHRLPLAIRAEVSDGFRLTMFLTGVRALMDQAAPGMTIWETFEHNQQQYVRITPARRGEDAFGKLAIFYAPTPDSLTLAVNEDLLKRAIERAGKAPEAAAGAVRPWLGSSVAVQLDKRVIGLLAAFKSDDYQLAMQTRAWANLPILNEWHRRYQQYEPVDLHAKWWQTTLRCPGGGKYVWNERFQTMESTVYGHPGEPKSGPYAPPALNEVNFLNFGLTFQDGGLRARAVVDRQR